MPYRQITGVGHDGRVAINDPDPALLAAHVALTVSAHGIGGEWFQTYLQRGVARAGITTGEAGYFFEEFTDVSRWQETAGGGTRLALVNVPGGVVQIDVPLGPNIETNVPGSLAYGNPTVIHGGQRWYISSRMRMALLPPAGGQVLAGAVDIVGGVQLIVMGFYGGVSMTNFAFGTVGPGAPGLMLSSVALDNAWHDIEHWHDGTTFYGAVDGETPVSYTMPAPPTTMMSPFFMGVSTGVAQVTFDLDKYLAVFPQAA